MIAHDRRIAENTASDRHRLYMEALFNDRAVVNDRQQLYENTFSDRAIVGERSRRCFFSDL